MFTDIVGFSRMMEEDERGTLKTLDFHDKLVREQVDRFRGSVIKTIGDAFLAQFQTTLDAVQCSLAVQEGIREYNEAKLGKPLTLRIGVHLGDIYFYENDALGEGINIASRLQSATKPGHITISREVYSQVSGKIPMKVESMGQVHLKNITREVHAYEIIPGGEDNNSSAYRKAHKAAEPLAEPVAEPIAEPAAGPSVESPGAVPRSAAPMPPPSFRDLRDEWRSLRVQIRDQSQEARRGITIDPGSMVAQFFHDPLDDLRTEDGKPASPYQIYKQKRLRGSKKAKTGFRGHLIPFVAVNGFLIFLYASLTPGEHPWFLYPLFGWGIGLASHWSRVKAAKTTTRELDLLEEASNQDLQTIKKFQDARGAFYSHVVSNIAVSLLLLMIWVITGGGFAWPLIPIGAMAIGVLSHLTRFTSRRSEFKDLWKSLTAGLPRPSKTQKPAAVEPEVDPLVRKARALRDSIVAQAQGMKGGNPFGEDMTLTLDNYVLQIGELSSIEQELGRVVVSFNPADLDAEEVAIRAKIASTSSATLKQEYDKSLAEIVQQKKSFGDLAEQQEILNLRLKSAMGNLQQMQIDLARIKGLSDGQKEGYFLSIKDRSEELSRYIEDYREGLGELAE